MIKGQSTNEQKRDLFTSSAYQIINIVTVTPEQMTAIKSTLFESCIIYLPVGTKGY